MCLQPPRVEVSDISRGARTPRAAPVSARGCRTDHVPLVRPCNKDGGVTNAAGGGDPGGTQGFTGQLHKPGASGRVLREQLCPGMSSPEIIHYRGFSESGLGARGSRKAGGGR